LIKAKTLQRVRLTALDLLASEEDIEGTGREETPGLYLSWHVRLDFSAVYFFRSDNGVRYDEVSRSRRINLVDAPVFIFLFLGNGRG
jgi:hypothetical protein